MCCTVVAPIDLSDDDLLLRLAIHGCLSFGDPSVRWGLRDLVSRSTRISLHVLLMPLHHHPAFLRSADGRGRGGRSSLVTFQNAQLRLLLLQLLLSLLSVVHTQLVVRRSG